MPGHIQFILDEKNGIVIATPKWKIDSESDCRGWYEEWVSYLSQFNHKVDCIIILDDFSINSEIASAWGGYRAKINNEFIRFGYRVNPELAVSLFVKTSGIRYRAATAEAASVEDAVQAILEERKKLQ